jgi:hypothetical protein
MPKLRLFVALVLVLAAPAAATPHERQVAFWRAFARSHPGVYAHVLRTDPAVRSIMGAQVVAAPVALRRSAPARRFVRAPRRWASRREPDRRWFR